MSLSGRITILHSLTFRRVSEGERYVSTHQPDPSRINVVYDVGWFRKAGNLETWTSETWKPIARNMWQATSQKK